MFNSKRNPTSGMALPEDKIPAIMYEDPYQNNLSLRESMKYRQSNPLLFLLIISQYTFWVLRTLRAEQLAIDSSNTGILKKKTILAKHS